MTEPLITPIAVLAALDRRDLDSALEETLRALSAESGTLHFLGADGQLHLAAHGPGMPAQVLDVIRTIPVGKGMAGLAVERREPVAACNLKTDESGDVRPGAKATGLEGSIVVPVLTDDDEVVGALGVANRAPRTFTNDEIATLTAIGRALAPHRA
ncbi:MAG: GAF domain-containing protein [Planctomycetota bacterium]